MRLDGMKILYLLGPEFEDLEFYVPMMRLQEEGAQVTVAGAKAGEKMRGKNGVPATADVNFDDLKSADFDAIIVPGGWAPDKLRRSESVRRLVREIDQAGKTVGMICHAGLVGISAGVVAGHNVTGSEGIKDDLINAGGVWQDVPALRSGNQVWGRVVADIPDFCRELVQALIEQKQNRV